MMMEKILDWLRQPPMAQLNNDLLAGGFDKLMQQAADPQEHRPSLH